MKKILFVAIIATVAITACKKKDTSTPTPPPTPTPVDTNKATSRYDALTTDKWKITAVHMSKGDTLIVDYYDGQMKDCEKDNFIFFNKSGSITSDEGATKCDASAAQITTDGSWTLNSDTTMFTIKDSKILPISGTATAKVILIDKTNFKISKDTTIVYPGIGSISGTIYANFSKVK